MPLSYFACSNCGHWQHYFAAPPDCPVCTDTRNDLPADGWDFRPEADVAERLRGSWRTVGRDMVAFNTAPRFGLNGTGWLLLHPEGNVAFEAAPYYTPPMLAEIRRLGVLELPTGQTLFHVGGHYEGQAVMHDPARRTLFCGDAFKIDQDERGGNVAMSSHKAFHKDIPLTPHELRRYREVIARLDFDTVCTPFEYGSGITPAMAVAVLEDGMQGPPGVRRIPMDELKRRSAA